MSKERTSASEKQLLRCPNLLRRTALARLRRGKDSPAFSSSELQAVGQRNRATIDVSLAHAALPSATTPHWQDICVSGISRDETTARTPFPLPES